MTLETPVFDRNMSQLSSIDAILRAELFSDGEQIAEIPNAKGTQNSLKVYAAIRAFNDGPISVQQAEKGIDLFAEHAVTALSDPTTHPNIQYLIAASRGAELSVHFVYNTPQ